MIFSERADVPVRSFSIVLEMAIQDSGLKLAASPDPADLGQSVLAGVARSSPWQHVSGRQSAGHHFGAVK